MSNINPGDMVEHRTSDDRYVVATTGLVCCVRMLEGARITDFFHPHELEVTEPAERVRGLNYEHRWMAMDAGPPEFDARDGVAEAITCVECGSIFGPRPDPLYGAFRCPQCGAHHQRDGEAEGGIRYIPPLGLREKEGRDTADPEDSVDVPLPDIHGKRCVSCNSWGDASCSRGRPTSRDGSTRACDEWEARSLRDVMPCCTGEPGPIDGEPVPERAELDVEDARETLEGAGWLLIPPDEVISEDVVDRYASILTQAGVAMIASDVDIVLAGAMVRRGWAVVVDEDGSRLYPPGQDERLSVDDAAGRLHSSGWLLFEPGRGIFEPQPEGGVHPELIQGCEDTLRAAGYTVITQGELPEPDCWFCMHWDSEAPEPCQKDMSPDNEDPQPCDRFHHRWQDVAEHLSSVIARAHVAARDEDDGPPDNVRLSACCFCALRDEHRVAPWHLSWACAVGHTEPVAKPSDCPDHAPSLCRDCEHITGKHDEGGAVFCGDERVVISETVPTECVAWSSKAEQPPALLTAEAHIEALEEKGYLVFRARQCTDCAHWEYDARLDQGRECEHTGLFPDDRTAEGCDDFSARDTEQPPVPTYPTPPAGLEDDTLAKQLDWLRANDLPTGKGRGKSAKTTTIVKLLRLGYYDPATVEQLTSELQWPPEAARCPVVGENGEPCGSETPEACEHPLPAVPGDGE